MFIHDLAYKVMMVTGIGVTILNLNPLIKLDGYYLLAELIDETASEGTVHGLRFELDAKTYFPAAG